MCVSNHTVGHARRHRAHDRHVCAGGLAGGRAGAVDEEMPRKRRTTATATAAATKGGSLRRRSKRAKKGEDKDAGDGVELGVTTERRRSGSGRRAREATAEGKRRTKRKSDVKETETAVVRSPRVSAPASATRRREGGRRDDSQPRGAEAETEADGGECSDASVSHTHEKNSQGEVRGDRRSRDGKGKARGARKSVKTSSAHTDLTGGTVATDSGTTVRFINPSQVVSFIKVGDDHSPFERFRGDEGIQYFTRLMEFITRILSRVFLVLMGESSRQSTTDRVRHINFHRFVFFVYFTTAFILEIYIMGRGVKVTSDTYMSLSDAHDPDLFIKGLYRRYVPLSILIDHVALILFFKLDERGRPDTVLQDYGIIFRHSTKIIMRHPAITLKIIGYMHPGHSFSNAQVLTIFSAPVVVAIRLGGLQNWLPVTVMCLMHFIVYPTYFIGLGRVLPVYTSGSRSVLSIKAWLAATMLPALVRVTQHMSRRGAIRSRSRPKRGLEHVSLHRGILIHLRNRVVESLKKTNELSEWRPLAHVQQIRLLHGNMSTRVSNYARRNYSLDWVRIIHHCSRRRTGSSLVKDVLYSLCNASEDFIRRCGIDVGADGGCEEFWLRQLPSVDQSRWIELLRERIPETTLNAREDFHRLDVLTHMKRLTYLRVRGPLRLMQTDTQKTEEISLCASNTVAISTGSAHVIKLLGKDIADARISVHVSETKVPCGSSVRKLQAVTPNIVTQSQTLASHNPAFWGNDGDKSLTSVTVVVNTSLCDPECEGSLAFHASRRAFEGISSSFPLIVTSDFDVVEELNAKFSYCCLADTTLLYLHMVGSALAGHLPVDLMEYLSTVAFQHDLPRLGHKLLAERSPQA